MKGLVSPQITENSVIIYIHTHSKPDLLSSMEDYFEKCICGQWLPKPLTSSKYPLLCNAEDRKSYLKSFKST